MKYKESLEKNVKIEIDFTFSHPKKFIATKKVNEILYPCIEKNYNWFVYYYLENPFNKKLERFKCDFDLNDFETVEDRSKALSILQIEVEKWLLEGYSPFKFMPEIPKLSNVLWTKPEIYIPKKVLKGKLYPDLNKNSYVYYFYRNLELDELEFFKIDIENNYIEHDWFSVLKKIRNIIEKKLINGFNPFLREDKITISKEEYDYYCSLRKFLSKQKNNYQSVFSDLYKEDIFYKILKSENVIDENNNPKFRFSTVAYNSFNIANKLQEQLFNTTKLSVFVEYLEEKYNFKPTDKTKFANINDNLNTKIGDFVALELNNLESSLNTNKGEFHPN